MLGDVTKLRVVSIEWFVNSLILGQRLDYTTNELFKLPKDPINHPTVHKFGPENQRFAINDNVSYYTTEIIHKKKRKSIHLGKIISFKRITNSTSSSTVNVNTMNDSNMIEIFIQPYEKSLIDQTNLSYSINNEYNNNNNKIDLMKCLTPNNINNINNNDNDNSLIKVNGNDLIDKIIILPKVSYYGLHYTIYDSYIYCASNEWEELEESLAAENENEDDSTDDVDIHDSMRRRTIKSSQDY